MGSRFIKREIFVKNENSFIPISIYIFCPYNGGNGFFYSKIEFDFVRKYNAVAKGIDEFNAVGSAIDYVSSICKNSEDPEFFTAPGESMKVK
jgi:hypothetical protein